ncbi:hypothetical protein ACR9YC_00365 [Parasphingorhabdus sp. DH2-15]|uniref:hypothetical protein n=1 Tax=Parasphingorhabdus sp. DH2-15 TaxID=3444112 RepID=UPI003F684FFE
MMNSWSIISVATWLIASPLAGPGFHQTKPATDGEAIEAEIPQKGEGLKEAITAKQATEKPVKPSQVVLPAGYEIALVLSDDLSTKRQTKGSLFNLEVAQDVVIDGVLVIPQGAKVVGEVSSAQKKGMFGKSGSITARLLYVELADRTVRLQGEIGYNRRKKAGAVVSETLLTATAFGLISGRSAVIPKGTSVTARVAKDVVISS